MTLNNKTHIVAGLLFGVMLISSSSINLVSIRAYAYDANSIPNTIPDDKLLPRAYNDWKDQYTQDNFYKEENSVKWYVDGVQSGTIPNNILNKAVARDLMLIHNFDTIVGKKSYGQEILALVISKERLTNAYSADEQVKQFHDWIVSKYTMPTTVSGLDMKLKSMEYDKYKNLASQVISAYNDAAEHGIVPTELFAKNPTYWENKSFIAFCKEDPNCTYGKSSDEIKTVDATTYGSNILDNIYTWISQADGLIGSKQAYADTPTHYQTYLYYEVTPSYSCGDESSICPISQSTIGVGPVQLSFNPTGDTHVYGSSVYVYGVAYDHANWQSTNNVSVNVDVNDGVYDQNYQPQDCVASGQSTGYVSASNDCTVSNDPQGIWQLSLVATGDTWSN